MLRALEKFNVQDVEKTLPHVVNPVREGSFPQSAQGNVPGFLLGGGALRLIGELLGCAGVAEPDGYVVNRMDVVQAAFSGLKGNSQHDQVVIFQEEMVVWLLLDGNGCGGGSFLCGKEGKEDNCGRDVVPRFHGRNLSRGIEVGRFYWLDKNAPMDFCARRRSWQRAEKQVRKLPRGQNLHSRLSWKRRPG
jgi:hypothetical protein